MYKKIGLLFLSVFFSVLAIEVIFRTYGTVKGIDFRLYELELTNTNRLPEELFISDPLIEGILQPNHQFIVTTSDFSVIYAINSQGLRDKEYDKNRDPQKTRFLAFGDSFTFGEGVSYGNRLADVPEEVLKNIEIINFGIPGMGFDKTLLYLARDGITYNPQYVFIFLNSVLLQRETYGTQQITTFLESLQNGEKFENQVFLKSNYLSREKINTYKKRSIFSHSYLLSYIQYQWKLREIQKTLETKNRNSWKPEKEKFMKEIQNKKTENAQNETATQEAKTTPVFPENRDAFIAEKIKDICDLQGCKVIFVNLDRAKLDFEAPKGTLFFDLSDPLLEYGKNNEVTFTYDPHYNEKTNIFLGTLLTQIIQEKITP